MGRRAILLLAATCVALTLAGGVALAVTRECEPGADCRGTDRADRLTGTNAPDRIFGRDGSDVLKGGGAVDHEADDDLLSGGKGNDKLYGHGGPWDETDGQDELIGGPGNDLLDPGYGRVNYYYFSKGWGRDVIVPRVGDTAVRHDMGDVANLSGVTGGMLIDLNPGKGPEIETRDGRDTVSWRNAGVVNRVSAGSGNDHIKGDAGANDLYGGGGADTIIGGEGAPNPYNHHGDSLGGGPGADTIVVGQTTHVSFCFEQTCGAIVDGGGGDDRIDARNESVTDWVDCGAGFDTAFFDPGDLVSNCERRNP